MAQTVALTPQCADMPSYVQGSVGFRRLLSPSVNLVSLFYASGLRFRLGVICQGTGAGHHVDEATDEVRHSRPAASSVADAPARDGLELQRLELRRLEMACLGLPCLGLACLGLACLGLACLGPACFGLACLGLA